MKLNTKGGTMTFKRSVSRFLIPSLIVGVFLLLNSCRPMITPEQLQELKDLRAKEKSLTEQINSKKGDINKIKSEISSREAEFKDCSEKSDFVKQKLSMWPNVWPDWNPQSENTQKESEK